MTTDREARRERRDDIRADLASRDLDNLRQVLVEALRSHGYTPDGARMTVESFERKARVGQNPTGRERRSSAGTRRRKSID